MNNALTVDDDSAALKKKLESIPEVLQISDNDGIYINNTDYIIGNLLMIFWYE